MNDFEKKNDLINTECSLIIIHDTIDNNRFHGTS